MRRIFPDMDIENRFDPAQPHLEGAILHFVYGQQRVHGDDNGQLLSLGQG